MPATGSVTDATAAPPIFASALNLAAKFTHGRRQTRRGLTGLSAEERAVLGTWDRQKRQKEGLL